MGIWGAPPVLLIHLKRFQENQYGAFEKNEKLVQYPVQGLNLAPFLVNGEDKPSRGLDGVSGQGLQTRLAGPKPTSKNVRRDNTGA